MLRKVVNILLPAFVSTKGRVVGGLRCIGVLVSLMPTKDASPVANGKDMMGSCSIDAYIWQVMAIQVSSMQWRLRGDKS